MAEVNYDITPENAPRFAADVVSIVEERERTTLDYSVKSLEIIDQIVGRFHSQGLTFEEMAATVFNFGCYVGEVFVKNVGAQWRAATQEEIDTIFGMPLVLELGNGKTLNPIGKVKKRLENGEEDSLPYFYHVFAT